MKHRYYTPEDYEELCQWWRDWEWSPFPEIALPATGIVVFKDGVNLAASFIYKTDSCVCWAENFITNKKAPKELRAGSVDFLIEKTVEEGANLGFKMMMSSVKHDGLIRKLVKAGYEEQMETGMTNLVRRLWQQ